MRRFLIPAALLTLAALLLLILPRYLKDLRVAKEQLARLATTTIDTPVATIEYYRTGTGVPVLISHGITGGYDQGLGLARLYMGDGYDLIATSRFGYLGSSIPDDSSPDAQADAYAHLLDDLELDRAYIMGNSAGGTSAIKFALKYPERCLGLILVSSNVPSESAPRLAPKALSKVLFGSDLAYWLFVKLMGENMLPMIGAPKSITATLTQDQRAELLAGVIMGGLPISERTAGVINDMYLSNPDINRGYPFQAIKVPTLIISAKDDPLCLNTGAQAISEQIADSRLISFETGGHLLLGREQAVRQVIADFTRTSDETMR